MEPQHRTGLDALTAVGLVVLFVAVAVLELGQDPSRGARPVDAAGYALLVGTGLVFAIRSRWPRVYFSATLLLTFAYIGLRYEPGPVYLAPLLALVLLVGAVEQRFWLPAVVLGGAGFALVTTSWPGTSTPSAVFAVAVWFVVAAGAASAVRARRTRLVAVTRRAEVAERTREQEARRRVAEERLRIARELHDITAHSLATISLQSGVAIHLLGAQPTPTREALLSIRQVSTDALTELRAVLGVLRPDGGEGEPGDTDPPLAPAPHLGELGGLVESMRAAGLHIEVRDDLDTAPVSDAAGRAGYRIVQEALTNAARHAGAGASVRLRLARLADAVEIEVVNDRAAGPGTAHRGRGIVGMRERAGALGGTCTAGAEPGGTFRVWAVLPVGPTSPASPASPTRSTGGR